MPRAVNGLKECSKCGETKAVSEYYRDASKKKGDGLRYHCKECVRRAAKRWQQSNREADRERLRRWRKNNPALVREQGRRRYQKYRDARLDYRKRYRANNPEKTKDQARRYQSRRRARKEGNGSIPYTHQEIFERDEGLCWCGEPVDPENWWIEHIVPIKKGGPDTPTNVCVSHPGCNNGRPKDGSDVRFERSDDEILVVLGMRELQIAAGIKLPLDTRRLCTGRRPRV